MLPISCLEPNSLNIIFHQAIELNNAGVDLYKLGNYEAAMRCLYNALSGMQRFSAFHQGSLSDSEQQTIMESMTSFHAFPDDSIMTQIVNQNHVTRGYRQQTQDIRPSDYLLGESPRYRGAIFNGDNQRSCISHVRSASPAGSSNSYLMDSSTNKRQGNDVTPIDTNAIYRYALDLVCNGDCSEAMANPAFSCSRVDVVRIRASILFNLGLAHHMIAGNASSFLATIHRDAVSPGDHPFGTIVARSLEKAKAFYLLSLKLQESEKAPISTQYLMALCNNIGQCYISLNRRSESIAWADRLLRLLVCYQQRRDFKQRSKPANECFIRNTSWLILRDPYTAPTA